MSTTTQKSFLEEKIQDMSLIDIPKQQFKTLNKMELT